MKLKVIGVGGAGLSVLGTLKEKEFPDSFLLGIDYDGSWLPHLAGLVPSEIALPIQTRGLGNPGILHWRILALSRIRAIAEIVFGVDRVILTVGLGGATGTGIAPVIASAVRVLGAEVAIFASMPYEFEGKNRQNVALENLALLEELAHDVRIYRPESLIDEHRGFSDWRETLTINEAFPLLDELMAEEISDEINSSLLP